MFNDIGYVTSFSPDLFKSTGKELLNSHRAVDSQRALLVCAEGGIDLSPWPVRSYNLDGDKFLRDWLAANRDIIPNYLGGDAGECACEQRHERHGKHKKRCHFSWMNRNAARFFRKVAAWNHVLTALPYRYVVWLDSDCVFQRPLSTAALRAMLKGACLGYFRGRREAAETGILIFDRQTGGDDFIRRVCTYFTSGAFRQEDRWDDGFIVTKVIDKHEGVYRDLVNKRLQRGNNVIPVTEISRFFVHLKGSHGTRLNIMR